MCVCIVFIWKHQNAAGYARYGAWRRDVPGVCSPLPAIVGELIIVCCVFFAINALLHLCSGSDGIVVYFEILSKVRGGEGTCRAIENGGEVQQ